MDKREIASSFTGKRTPRLDENQAELGVLVLAVGLEVLADGNGLLDQHVEILGDLGGEAWKRSESAMNQLGQIYRALQLQDGAAVDMRFQPGRAIVPLLLRMRRTLLPVTTLVWAIPWLSLRTSPILRTSACNSDISSWTRLVLLGGSGTLPGELADLLNDLLGRGLELLFVSRESSPVAGANVPMPGECGSREPRSLICPFRWSEDDPF